MLQYNATIGLSVDNQSELAHEVLSSYLLYSKLPFIQVMCYI